MVSKLNPVFMIFALSLFNNYFAASAKCLGGTIINVYRNYDSFYIESALTGPAQRPAALGLTRIAVLHPPHPLLDLAHIGSTY